MRPCGLTTACAAGRSAAAGTDTGGGPACTGSPCPRGAGLGELAGLGVSRSRILEVVTSTATPPTWTYPAVALGKQSTAQAELFWAEHVRADGDVDFEIDGSIKP